jgi:hypothetical protein
MSTVSSENSSKTGFKPPGNLQLTNWPLVDDAPRTWPMIALALGLSLFAGYWSQSILMGVLCFAVISLAIWRTWIPVFFDLGPKGIEQTMLGRKIRIPWPAIARYEVTSQGVVLVPESNRITFRSFYIRWGDHKERLLQLVQYYVLPRATDGNSGVRRSS